jgi:hypothetical protein
VPAGKEFLSKLDRMFRSALDPLTVFKAFQEKAGRFTASASRAVVEARGFLRAAFSNPALKARHSCRKRSGFAFRRLWPRGKAAMHPATLFLRKGWRFA